jgi:hypothetical protein
VKSPTYVGGHGPKGLVALAVMVSPAVKAMVLAEAERTGTVDHRPCTPSRWVTVAVKRLAASERRRRHLEKLAEVRHQTPPTIQRSGGAEPAPGGDDAAR